MWLWLPWSSTSSRLMTSLWERWISMGIKFLPNCIKYIAAYTGLYGRKTVTNFYLLDNILQKSFKQYDTLLRSGEFELYIFAVHLILLSVSLLSWHFEVPLPLSFLRLTFNSWLKKLIPHSLDTSLFFNDEFITFLHIEQAVYCCHICSMALKWKFCSNLLS